MAQVALACVDIKPPLDIDGIIPFTRMMVEHEWPAIPARPQSPR
jgi:hypothetical protein